MNQIIILFAGVGLSGRTSTQEIINRLLGGDLDFDYGSTEEYEPMLTSNVSFNHQGEVLCVKFCSWSQALWRPTPYDERRSRFLNEVDGIIYTVDSQERKQEECQYDWQILQQNLYSNIPIVMQYNKRDLPDIVSVDYLNTTFNPQNKYKFFPTVAATGEGVRDLLRGVIQEISPQPTSMTQIKQKSIHTIKQNHIYHACTFYSENTTVENCIFHHCSFRQPLVMQSLKNSSFENCNFNHLKINAMRNSTFQHGTVQQLQINNARYMKNFRATQIQSLVVPDKEINFLPQQYKNIVQKPKKQKKPWYRFWFGI